MGNLHLVTGTRGVKHVTSADHASFHAAIFGEGQYVLNRGNKFATTTVTNNQIRVADGDILMQGRHIRLNEGSYVDLTIENGAQGYLRNDLIVARYTKDSATGIEDCNLVVIKGTAAASEPVDPAYTNGDIINDHVLIADMPLYRVPLNGLNVQELVPLFEEASLFADGSITASKLARNSVTTEKIPDGAVTKEKLDPNLQLDSNDVYIGSETPTGENLPKLWVNPADTRLPLTMTMLWENPKPTATFAVQTIELDLSGYDGIYVEADYSTNVFCRIGQSAMILADSNVEAHGGTVMKRGVKATQTSVLFEDCVISNIDFYNDHIIPLRIYGIKGVN